MGLPGRKSDELKNKNSRKGSLLKEGEGKTATSPSLAHKKGKLWRKKGEGGERPLAGSSAYDFSSGDGQGAQKTAPNNLSKSGGFPAPKQKTTKKQRSETTIEQKRRRKRDVIRQNLKGSKSTIGDRDSAEISNPTCTNSHKPKRQTSNRSLAQKKTKEVEEFQTGIEMLRKAHSLVHNHFEEIELGGNFCEELTEVMQEGYKVLGSVSYVPAPSYTKKDDWKKEWAGLQGVVSRLLELGADVNEVDADSHTNSLVYAGRAGHYTLVDYLCGQGASPSLSPEAFQFLRKYHPVSADVIRILSEDFESYVRDAGGDLQELYAHKE